MCPCFSATEWKQYQESQWWFWALGGPGRFWVLRHFPCPQTQWGTWRENHTLTNTNHPHQIHSHTTMQDDPRNSYPDRNISLGVKVDPILIVIFAIWKLLWIKVSENMNIPINIHLAFHKYLILHINIGLIAWLSSIFNLLCGRIGVARCNRVGAQRTHGLTMCWPPQLVRSGRCHHNMLLAALA